MASYMYMYMYYTWTYSLYMDIQFIHGHMSNTIPVFIGNTMVILVIHEYKQLLTYYCQLNPMYVHVYVYNCTVYY